MVKPNANGERADAIIEALLRQIDPLARAKGRDEWLSAADIAAHLGQQLGAQVNRSTIFRAMQDLLGKGLVQASGETKSRRYRLSGASPAYLEWDLSRPAGQRAPVAYNPELLAAYKPNRTKWLGTAARARLTAAGRAGFEADAASYRRVMNSLLIDLSYASSRLEDVRISWRGTKTLIELGERPAGLTDREHRIVMNHKDAIEYLATNRADLAIDRRTVFDVHRLLAAGLLGNPADGGRIRRSIVFFDDSAYRPLANQFQPRLCMNVPLLRARMAPFSFAQVNRPSYMFGLLAFYERGRPEFLTDVFEDAYAKGAPRYVEIMRVLHGGGTLGSVSPMGRA